MPQMVWRQLRARAGRSTALLLAIFAAITGFTVLTGATATSQLAVTSTVTASARPAYDILVRPAASRDSTERDHGLVRPNQLAGQYGGISLAQWAAIKALPGVSLAAPVAMIGYVSATATVRIDVTSSLDPTLQDQVVRLRPTWSGDAGLTRATEPEPRFVYVTKRTVAVAAPTPQGLIGPDGRLVPAAALLAVGCDWREIPFTYLELMPDDSWRPICGTWFLDNPHHSRYSELNQAQFFVFQALPDGQFLDFTRVGGSPDPDAGTQTEPRSVDRVAFNLPWPLWLGLAAVDPVAESRLVGLDAAITGGRYFDQPSTPGTGPMEIPVLVTRRSPVSEQLTVTTERLSGSSIDGVTGLGPQRLLERLSQAAATGNSVTGTTYQAADLYSAALADPGTTVRLDISVGAHAPTYAPTAGLLRPRTVTADPAAWATPVSGFGELATGATAHEPYLATDVGFRALTHSLIPPLVDLSRRPTLARIGVFDPTRLATFSALSAVPLETYQSPATVGGDPRSRALLGGRPLLPTNNPAGYVAAPPAALMTLADAVRLTGDADLISAIRVRVAGVTGVDAISRERVRLVAQAIAQTGLDVDVTVGSSPQLVAIDLPAGRYGRPELTVHEGWTKKGVATAILLAVDRKSVALFGLVLVVCLLFVANATSAAVRERSRELALLSCLGWPGWRRAALVLSEVAVIGVVAGSVAVAAAGPVARSLGVATRSTHGWLALPVAVAVALLAGLAPALRAARSHPATALQPGALRTRTSRRRLPRRGTAPTGSPRSVPSIRRLAARNLFRAPGRTFAGVAALAIAVAALTLLAALLWAFDGSVVGTLLGNVVSLRARQVDVVAVLAVAALAVGSVTDVLYLSTRERGSEFAILRATGWTEGELSLLVLAEGALLALLGTTVGAAAGLAGIAALSTGLSFALVRTTALVALASLLLTISAALVPALLLGRAPTARLLADES